MGINLIKNPSFEVDLNGWILDPDTGSMARDTTTKLSGAASLQVTTPGTNPDSEGAYYGDNPNLVNPPIKVVPGRSYAFSGWILGAGTLRLEVIEQDSSGNPFGNKQQGTSQVASATLWKQLQLTYVATAAAAYGVRVKVETAIQQAVTFNFDDASFQIIELADAAAHPPAGRGASW